MTTVICCSYAFMLPVATAPNALVYSGSTLKQSSMMAIGLGMNVLCVLMTNVWIYFTGSFLIEPLFDGVPSWVQDPTDHCNITLTN